MAASCRAISASTIKIFAPSPRTRTQNSSSSAAITSALKSPAALKTSLRIMNLPPELRISPASVPPDREAVLARVAELHRLSTPARLAELTMLRLDGSPIHVETTATAVLFDGQPSVLTVIRDVSARRELVARTMHVDWMLAVGTLAAGVGHEINNPLAYVLANVAYASGEITRVQQQLQNLVAREASAAALASSLSDVVGVLAEVATSAGDAPKRVAPARRRRRCRGQCRVLAERQGAQYHRHRADGGCGRDRLANICLSIILPENRYPLFGITL